LTTISEFEFEIIYIKDKENRDADALSGKVQLSHVAAVSSY